MKWGATPSQMSEAFQDKGWLEVKTTDGQSDYVLKIGDDEEKFDPIMDEVVYPYKVSLFFNNDRLSVARIFRIGSSEEIKKFKKDFTAAYGLNQPEIAGKTNTGKTPGGSSFSSTSEIFSGSNILVKIYENSIVSEETKVKDENIEIQIFSVKENEGISVKGLAELDQ